MFITCLLVFELNNVEEGKIWSNNIFLPSKMQSFCISKGKNLSGDRGWILTDLCLDYWMKPTCFLGSSAFFLFCERVNQKEIEYHGNVVDVKQKTTFSLKQDPLKGLEKVVNISSIRLIWDKEYKQIRFIKLNFHSILRLIHPCGF